MRPWYALFLLAGCVVPQSVEQAPPARTDQPPFALATYPPQGTVTLSRNCSSGLTFQVFGVSDCDLQDSVEVHWLANYDPIRPGLAPGSGSLFHSGPGGRSAGCTRDPGSDRWTMVPGDFSSSSTVQVEALLSDGFDPTAAPIWRAAGKDRQVYRVAWTVVMSDGPCLENAAP